MSLFLVFRTVFFKEPEEDIGLIFIEGSLELSNDWGNLDSSEQNSLLSLEGNVLRPSDKSGQISLRLDTIADSVIPGLGLE